MAGRDTYVKFEIVAYRVRGADGWRVSETLAGLDGFDMDMKARGIPVAEVRSVTRGARRADAAIHGRSQGDIDTFVLLDSGWAWVR